MSHGVWSNSKSPKKTLFMELVRGVKETISEVDINDVVTF